jgi:trehalose 6-phosphate phosphatase
VDSRRYLVSVDAQDPEWWVVSPPSDWPRAFVTRADALHWARAKVTTDERRGLQTSICVRQVGSQSSPALANAATWQSAANDPPRQVADNAIRSEGAAGIGVPPLPPQRTRIALFLDLDGTLAPLASRPELVSLPRTLVELIARLDDCLCGAVAIISGRTLDEIDALVSPLALAAAGVHGAQLRRAPQSVETAIPAEWARIQVRAACAAVELPEGAWLETKADLSFAFHFRGAPSCAPWIAQRARSIAARTGGAYVVQFGDGIAEVKPANSDKGTALLELMRTSAFQGRMPFVLGDDLTDEAAFAEARLWDGRGIVVGPRQSTNAVHRLESPAAVHSWLLALLHTLERREEGLAT